MTRVMIVVTHLLGVGHLARMAALSRALSLAGDDVTLVSGGRPIGTSKIGAATFVQLPPVHILETDFRALFTPEGVLANKEYLDRRCSALIAAFDKARPDVLITELFPFGRRALEGEFIALLDHARQTNPKPVVLSSVRDVLNPPSRPERVSRSLRHLANYYDGVLFHADADVVPLSASWPVTPSLQRRLTETGYVHDGELDEREVRSADGFDEIIVSGGGSAAGLPLCSVALDAALIVADRQWRVLVGRGVADEDFEELRSCAPPNALVERARPDFPELLARCALSISQAGYNTMLDLAAANARAIFVPFVAGGEKEQSIRANLAAERGLAQTLDENGLTGAELAEAAIRALAATKPDWSAFKRDGASRTVSLLGETVRRSREERQAWLDLDLVLERARTTGRQIPFWWRDDDAIEPTPELDEFLARITRWHVPVAFASIPGRTTPALAAHLEGFPNMDVLVHGWTHKNHASKGEKAAEFGAHRSRETLASEALEGRARIEDLFGRQCVPVFVPPWNRVDRAFLDVLPNLGFTGISTFGRRMDGDRPDTLTRVNTHWDPIAWKDGGGLKDKTKLLRQLIQLIDDELGSGPDVLEPIGILTHHLVHDAFIDAFLDELVPRLIASGTVRFVGARELFALSR